MIIPYTQFNLQKEYDRLNKELFNTSLINIPLGWDNTVKSGGRVVGILNKKTGIKKESLQLNLSKKFNRTYDDWINTLIHEMIHVKQLLDGYIRDMHGYSFQRWMNEINKKGYNVNIYDVNTDKQLTVKKRVGVVIYDKKNDKHSITVVPEKSLNDWYVNLPKEIGLKYNNIEKVYFLISDNTNLIGFPIKNKYNLQTYALDKDLYDDLMNNNKIMHQFDVK